MSVEQYQRQVNTLDKDIADLEKRKADYDKKYADETNKAANESAILQKRIADKRAKRNEAYIKLQKEEQNQRKKELREQENRFNSLQQSYEERIAELELAELPAQVVTDSDCQSTPEYDVFVSHAWEDKESFVDEFVQALNESGLKVWYDTGQMKWGDSMRKKIDEGLVHSRFGVVVLSPNYIAEGKYWTKAELDGLFQLDSINGKTLLPIWHELTKKQVMEFSPMIAAKLAMTTATMTAQEIANELVKLIPNADTED